MSTEQSYIYHPEWHTGRLSKLVIYTAISFLCTQN